jgi:hypothetical protein
LSKARTRNGIRYIARPYMIRVEHRKQQVGVYAAIHIHEAYSVVLGLSLFGRKAYCSFLEKLSWVWRAGIEYYSHQSALATICSSVVYLGRNIEMVLHCHYLSSMFLRTSASL